MRRKLRDPAGRAVYQRRKAIVEPVIGILKQQRGMRQFRRRGLGKVVAWQLAAAMKQQNISKNKMATLLKTSRTQVDRLLDPKNDITLGSLQRAAAMVGRRVNVEVV